MARVPLDIQGKGLLVRLAGWYSTRKYGKILEPLAAASPHPGVLAATGLLELGAQRWWHRLDPTLHCLAVQMASAQIGCSWCLDFGYWEAHHKGVDPAKIRDVPHWRDSDVYSPVERLVLEYAEAMTVTPPTVTDELVARLREHLDDAQFVELTALVSVENLRSRTNAALGLESQGFKAICEVR
ncbi:MAG: carboxymuconolactone decarboxylase family protein [Streptosporangiales bacterium]|nr:carboxymuconolactone decarboxylase family protein [Streptosporangiales bacterium]